MHLKSFPADNGLLPANKRPTEKSAAMRTRSSRQRGERNVDANEGEIVLTE